MQKSYVFLAVNPSSLVFHLGIDVGLESFPGSCSSMIVKNSLQSVAAFLSTSIGTDVLHILYAVQLCNVPNKNNYL